MRSLKPITGKRKLKEVRFGTADIETYEWINFLCIGFYEGYTDTYRWFSRLDLFLEFVFTHCEIHDIPTIWCHFGGKFDFNFILQEACFSSKYSVDNIIPRGSGILCWDLSLNPEHSESNFKLNFRDSSGLLPFALGSLTKAFKVPTQKGQVDFTFMKEAWENKNYLSQVLAKKDRYQVYYKKKKVRWYRPKKHQLNHITYIDKEDGKEHIINNKDKILSYLKADNVSLWQVIMTFYQWPLVKKAGLSFTTAGQAVKIWQTFLNKTIYSIPDSVDRFVRRAYFGGRTEIFIPLFDTKYNTRKNPSKFCPKAIEKIKFQKTKKKLYYYDVNSLYPTVMRDNNFGIKFESQDLLGKHYNPYAIGFYEAYVEVPEDMFCPPLPVNLHFTEEVIEQNFSQLSDQEKKHLKGTQKLVFPTGKFNGVWSIAEIEYAKTLGVKILKLSNGVIFKNGGKIFRPFIDALYKVRQEGKKKDKGGVDDILSKLIMNSCYGRLGLNINRENLIIDDGRAGVSLHSEIKKPGTDEVIRFMSHPVVLNNAFTNVAISAMVTAYSRILMHKIYLKAGREHLYYTDTDSIQTTKQFSIGDELGELKLEYTSRSACFLLPKTNINEGIEGEKFDKKVTMKGFDKKKTKHFTMDDFRLALAGDMRKLKIIQEPKFATLRTALNKGFFVTMNFDQKINKEIDKRKEIEYFNRTGKRKRFVKKDYPISERGIKSKYDKRIIINDGLDSIPIKLYQEINTCLN